MSTVYYLIAAIMTSQPNVAYKGFDANVIGKYTNATACANAAHGLDGFVVDASTVSPQVNSDTHTLCVQAPSVSSGVSYTLAVQYWHGKMTSARNVDRFTIPNFQNNAACVNAGEQIENSIEQHYSIPTMQNVFVDYRCVQVQ